jgi:hypothetical protein
MVEAFIASLNVAVITVLVATLDRPLNGVVEETVGAVVSRANVAVTDLAASIVRVQAVVPVQAPDQPVKLEPIAAVAVSVATLPVTNDPVHVAPQLIPTAVTVPRPVPAKTTLNV